MRVTDGKEDRKEPRLGEWAFEGATAVASPGNVGQQQWKHPRSFPNKCTAVKPENERAERTTTLTACVTQKEKPRTGRDTNTGGERGQVEEEEAEGEKTTRKEEATKGRKGAQGERGSGGSGKNQARSSARTRRPRLERSGTRPSGGALENCPRVFSVKTRCAGQKERGIHGKKTSSHGLEDNHASAPGRGVVEESFARLDVLEYRARVPVSFRPNGGTECAADGEIPGFGVPRGAVWDPDIGRAAEVAARGSGRAGGGGGSQSSGARGGKRPGFSLIGAREQQSRAMLWTTSRTAL